jgi:hypothetical protein
LAGFPAACILYDSRDDPGSGKAFEETKEAIWIGDVGWSFETLRIYAGTAWPRGLTGAYPTNRLIRGLLYDVTRRSYSVLVVAWLHGWSMRSWTAACRLESMATLRKD